MHSVHSALQGHPGIGTSLAITHPLIGMLPLGACFLPFPGPDTSCFLKMSFVMRFPDKWRWGKVGGHHGSGDLRLEPSSSCGLGF